MKIINQIRPDRQTVLFSATFPRQMEALARKILRRPLEITVGGRSIVAAEIEQIVEVRSEDSKFNRMLELLGKLFNEDNDARALIFVERQESADKLLADLLRKNYSCMSLHGGMEQVDRDQTIADFKTGVVPVVIATSVAARGLDVKQLKLVIQFDAPNHMEDYVHRAGRTGRAGNKGTCVTFLTPDQDRYSLDIFKALQASGAAVPDDVKAMAEGESLWFSRASLNLLMELRLVAFSPHRLRREGQGRQGFGRRIRLRRQRTRATRYGARCPVSCGASSLWRARRREEGRGRGSRRRGCGASTCRCRRLGGRD